MERLPVGFLMRRLRLGGQFRFVGGRHDSIAARLTLVALLAGVPLVALACSVFYQNYRQAGAVEAGDALQVQQAAATEVRYRLASSAAILRGVSRLPGVARGEPADCAGSLVLGLDLAAGSLHDIAVYELDGTWRCGTRGVPPGVVRARQPGRAAAGSPDPGTGQEDLRLRVPGSGLPALQVGAGAAPGLVLVQPVAGVLVRGVPELDRLEALRRPDRVSPGWISDGHVLASLGGARPGVEPSAGVLARLAAGVPVVADDTVRGAHTLYTSTALDGGLRLVVGYDARPERQAALRMLVRRAAWLALLLLAGLGGLILGAKRGVVAPLRGLGLAVGTWRTSGRFEAPRHALPLEVAALCDSFGRAAAALSAREAELVRAREQQELAMQEIHHRVKNNLQIVASLLNLQASRIRLPEAKAEFQSARDRVRALATLHRHLYAQGGVHTINMRSFLVELCGQLFQAMGEREGRRIALDIEAPELDMLSDQAVPLALIVTEAVSNALKYAFPGGRAGHVGVRLTEDGGNATLVIDDDGVGIPAGRSETETGTRDGIGLQLIRGFARQLGATLEVEEGHGTRYVVRMRLQREREAGAV